MQIVIMDFGSVETVAVHMAQSADNAIDTLIPMRAISNDLFAIERSQFVSNGRRGGGSWAPLKPDTIKRKGNARILVEDRGLVDSVTHRDAEFQILEVQNTELIFGTSRPWAWTHQGPSRAREDLPVRQFIKILPTDVNRWAGMIARHLVRPFKRENMQHYFHGGVEE